MINDPELDGKYLGTITKDFVIVAENLREASYQVRNRGYSDFPIFPISKSGQQIGQLLYAKNEVDTDWNYFITYLDEFIQRKLIEKNKVEEFKKIYKDPDEFCCLFVMDKDFNNIVFIPYPED